MFPVFRKSVHFATISNSYFQIYFSIIFVIDKVVGPSTNNTHIKVTSNCRAIIGTI